MSRAAVARVRSADGPGSHVWDKSEDGRRAVTQDGAGDDYAATSNGRPGVLGLWLSHQMMVPAWNEPST